MPSDDESSCFDVQSINSDTESQANWDASTESTDQFDFEPGEFRMPAHSVGFAARCFPVARKDLHDIKLPFLKPQNDQMGIEFIIFAPIGAARNISIQLQKIGDSERVSTSYYDGSGVCRLDGNSKATPSNRVAILFFSTVGSYDPLVEYEHFVATQGPLSCTPISDNYIDPFRPLSDSVCYTDKLTLMEAIVDKRHCYIPVPLALVSVLSADTLVPEKGKTKRLGDLNNKPLSSSKPWSVIVSILAITLLIASTMYQNSLPFSSIGVPTTQKAVYPLTSEVQRPHNVLTGEIPIVSGYPDSSPSKQVHWAIDPYFYLNSITGGIHNGLMATLNELSSLMTSTLQLIQNVLHQVKTSASSGCTYVKAHSVGTYKGATGGIRKALNDVRSQAAAGWESTQAFCGRWRYQASERYGPLAMKQFSAYFDGMRESYRQKCKSVDPEVRKIPEKSHFGDIRNLFK